MADFRMPALGADMESGKVVQWLVAPGARVKSGDVVAVIETHKGAIDCEIFLDGVIDGLAPLGEDLPVGALLAHVRVEGEAEQAPAVEAGLGRAGLPGSKGAEVLPSPVQPAAPVQVPAAVPVPEPLVAAAAPAAEAMPAGARPGGGRVRATPAARRRASELGIDLHSIPLPQPASALTLADVLHFAVGASQPQRASQPERQAAAQPPAQRPGFDPAAMRLAIAAAMSRSKREIPHYYLSRSIDFEPATRWLAAYNAERLPQDRLLAAVLLLKATAVALARYPQFNGFWADGAFRPGSGIHVGWAVAMRGGGLIAPAIHGVDRRTPAQLMADMRDLVQRVRTGGLRSSEMTDPTVTITSLGDRGADRVLGVIYPPQVALVGFGSAQVRPWVVDGQVVARTVVEASLAADHRASDGHAGGQLLSAVDEALQHPETL